MNIEFYGVRGSYPVPGNNTVKFGGNTTCVSISKEIGGKIIRIILDSGTGIIQLGKDIVNNFFAKKENLKQHIFFTHLHPDHSNGYPFFALNYFKNSELNLYGMQALNKHIGDVLSEQMYPPAFPLEYHDLKSKRNINILTDGDEIRILDEYDRLAYIVTCMQAYAPSHPQQGAMYYKIQDVNLDGTFGKTIACIWDHESKIGGDQAVIRFAKGCDVMIHDTQYTEEEYLSSKLIVQGFGHSTFEMALQNAGHAEIKEKLFCTHYNPNHSDNLLYGLESEHQKRERLSKFEIIFAKEQHVYTI